MDKLGFKCYFVNKSAWVVPTTAVLKKLTIVLNLSARGRTMPAVVLAALMLFGPSVARAQLQLSPLFMSGAVLQRDLALPVWGTAASGSEVAVTLNGTLNVNGASAV